MYLLDTNILIYAQKKRSPIVLSHIKSKDPSVLFVSIFSVAEMIFGCKKSLQPAQNHRAVLEFLLPFNVLNFEQEDCNKYGEVRHFLESNGRPIGTIDTFIGSMAVARSMTLVTNNVREFERIPGIKIENWIV
jgi:tRNA(fMet)-specific endonuclease VapC